MGGEGDAAWEKISSPTVNARVGDESRRRSLDSDEEMLMLALDVVLPRRRRMVAGSSSSINGPMSSTPLLDAVELPRLPLLSDRSMRTELGGWGGCGGGGARRHVEVGAPLNPLSWTRL
jgi:hypothetical protein